MYSFNQFNQSFIQKILLNKIISFTRNQSAILVKITVTIYFKSLFFIQVLRMQAEYMNEKRVYRKFLANFILFLFIKFI